MPSNIPLQPAVDDAGLVMGVWLRSQREVVGLNEIASQSVTDPADPVMQEGPLWLHFDRRSPATHAWLRQHAGLDPIVVDGLSAESTRPRIVVMGSGVLLTVRGVNLNPGADPADMISIRIWAEPGRVISLRGPRLLTVEAVIGSVRQGVGPQTVGQLVVALLAGLTDRMEPIIEAIDTTLDGLEDRVIDPEQTADRHELIALRQRTITLHRYLAPQTHAIAHLLAEGSALLNEDDQRGLKEQLNRMTRYVEDLDSAKGRSAVVQDELSNQLAEQANQRVYAVTVIAAIFLPLTLISGALGMNVGGIPLASHPRGFWITCIVLTVLGIASYWQLRRRRWL